MSECDHCWHETGELLTSDPPQHQLMCCYCAATKNVRDLPKMEIHESHGDFARQFNIKYRERRAMNAELELQEEQPKRTIEQLSQELNNWLQSRGVTLQIVAIGRSGTPVPIDDFMPPSHQATITLAQVQK